jgi:hypothetical protein
VFPLAAIPWRLIGAAALVAAFMLAGWRVSAWHDAYKALPGVQDALEREEGCLDGSKCRERQKAAAAAQAAKTKEVVDGYEKELADLRSRPVPDVPVRLCRPRGSGDVRVPGAAPGTGAGPRAELPLEAGRDIAVELYKLIDDTDTEALKLRKLWQRDKALSKPVD